MPTTLTFIIIIISHFLTHPRSHLVHLWLPSDLSSVTPPLILRAVVRISARGFKKGLQRTSVCFVCT